MVSCSSSRRAGSLRKALATLKPVQDLYPDSDAVKQRVNSISAAKAAQKGSKPQALPEPIQESIQNKALLHPCNHNLMPARRIFSQLFENGDYL